MSFIINLANSLNLGSNWLLVLVFLGIGLGYGIVMGKNRLNLVIISGYLSLIISRAIPWGLVSKNPSNSNAQIFVFLATLLAIFFLAPRSGFSSVVKISGRGRANWWQLLILGTLELGFLISAIVSFLPEKNVADLSPLAMQFFISQPAPFFWILLPLIALFLFRKHRSYTGAED